MKYENANPIFATLILYLNYGPFCKYLPSDKLEMLYN